MMCSKVHLISHPPPRYFEIKGGIRCGSRLRPQLSIRRRAALSFGEPSLRPRRALATRGEPPLPRSEMRSALAKVKEQ